jgi:uncharacterized protein (DUF1501 family)
MFQLSIATRREFLTQGLGLIGIGATLPNFLIRTALAGPQARAGEKVLVVLQLSGGHDGLSAIVPYRNDDYARNRTATRITDREVLKIDDEIGLHPSLKGFKELLDLRSFAVVQGVGYPNPNRSHFSSMDIWHRGDNAGKLAYGGWIGRYCDSAYKGVSDPSLALAIGGDKVPRALQGKEHPGLNLAQLDAYRFLAGRNNSRLDQTYRKLGQVSGAETGGNDTLEFVSRTAIDANVSSDAIQKLASQRAGSTSYPSSGLASSLQTVASLIAGGLSTRVYYVFQGGYDTHRGQRVRHDRLMTDLGDAVLAFQKDLAQQGLAERVVTMAFSEFGRRVRENGSQGTDHGTAGPMFLFGPALKPGPVNHHPSLAPANLANGDLKHSVDFRSVYATVLEKWLGTPSEPILGQKFPILNCLG